MACRSGCPSQDHPSYAACCRDGAPRVIYASEAGRHDYTAQKKWDRELSDYRDAVAQGIQPAGTDRRAIDDAVKRSDEAGRAYDAHNPMGLVAA